MDFLFCDEVYKIKVTKNKFNSRHKRITLSFFKKNKPKLSVKKIQNRNTKPNNA